MQLQQPFQINQFTHEGSVSVAIRAFQRLPLPDDASPEPTGKPNTYVITTAGHRITDEVIADQRIGKMLTVA